MSMTPASVLRKACHTLAAPDRLAALVFFALLLACGLLLYRDYGISWDEPTQLRIGIANYRYVTQQDPALLSLRDRYYGPLFEMLLVRFQSKGNDQAGLFQPPLAQFPVLLRRVPGLLRTGAAHGCAIGGRRWAG